MKLTASKLYDYLQCPHKVWRDAHGPMEEKIKEVNPFVRMLWERGASHEKEVVESLGEFLDLSEGSFEERREKTKEATQKGTPLIYQGVLQLENRLGIPDLLKKMPDGKYIPVDIKSGSGFEGAEDNFEEEGKPKDHYAVQLCFYLELLRDLEIPHGDTGKIIDIHKREVEYNLNAPRGKRNALTWSDFYGQIKNNVEVLLANKDRNKPAISSTCKLCPWYHSCKKWCQDSNDLTGLFHVGRSKRDVINQDLGLQKITEAVDLDVFELMEQKKKDKTFLSGVGKSTLEKIIRRAKIMTETKKPVLYKAPDFPQTAYELFFDIESDPTRDFVYLHGVWERHGNQEKFIHFTAQDNTRGAEEKAFADFWDYIRSLPEDDFSVYYYSAFEKTTYRKMQKQYPNVVSVQEVEGFFANPKVIDLYCFVRDHTDWPLGSYSIKDIAVYLGFQWRDQTPSGALSIEWFNHYLETKDEKKLQRILDYNEDDCRATMVLKDGLEKLAREVG